MAVVVFVQNNKTLQAYAKVRKLLQTEGIFWSYRNRRYFMTSAEKRRVAIQERVDRAKMLKMAQSRSMPV